MLTYITEESVKSEEDIISTIVGILLTKPNKKITISQRNGEDRMLLYYDRGEVKFIDETIRKHIRNKSTILKNLEV